MLLGLIWIWWVSAPTLALAFGALFAATLPFKRAHWWVGLIAGAMGVVVAWVAFRIPDFIFALGGTTSSWGYVGTPEEIQAGETRDLVTQIVLIAWCLGASLACTRLLRMPTKAAKSERTRLPSATKA